MLQSMGLQRVGHDLATEKQQQQQNLVKIREGGKSFQIVQPFSFFLFNIYLLILRSSFQDL